mmetsp:Transcript_3098/g.6622  ORF Transcript_3098/g.6622 Transcript_3098/m.6622 type:complete len:93 (+) Transcript_3098:172-450(+)
MMSYNTNDANQPKVRYYGMTRHGFFHCQYKSFSLGRGTIHCRSERPLRQMVSEKKAREFITYFFIGNKKNDVFLYKVNHLLISVLIRSGRSP